MDEIEVGDIIHYEKEWAKVYEIEGNKCWGIWYNSLEKARNCNYSLMKRNVLKAKGKKGQLMYLTMRPNMLAEKGKTRLRSVSELFEYYQKEV